MSLSGARKKSWCYTLRFYQLNPTIEDRTSMAWMLKSSAPRDGTKTCHVKSQSNPQGNRRARLKVRFASTRRRDGVQVRRSHS